MSHDDEMCLACGFILGFRPWDENLASFEVCPSCGIQFGYDDACGGIVSRRPAKYREWREIWIRGGKR